MTKDRRIVVAFFVSVVVNLALVSYIVGNHLASQRSDTMADPSYALSAMTRSLSEERIEELMPDYLGRLREDVRPHYGKLREAQTHLYRELTAKELNREQLELAIDNYWLIRHSAQSVADAVFVEMYVQLSEEERREVTSSLRGARARYDEWRRSRMRRTQEERDENNHIRGETDAPIKPAEEP